jgi:hypothetical protein
MRKLTRFAIAIALMTVALSVFWSYRVRAADQAAEFAPAAAQRVVLPAATVIEATITNGIPSSAEAGESVTATVSTPVLSAGKILIPSGAHLEGDLKDMTVFGTTVKAVVAFRVLTVGDRSFSIQTRPIMVAVPARSDTAILIAALRTIVGAGIGAGMGASSKDERLLQHALLEAASSSLSVESATRITVTLIHDLEIQRDPKKETLN